MARKAFQWLGNVHRPLLKELRVLQESPTSDLAFAKGWVSLAFFLFLQMENPVPWPMLSQLWPWDCHPNGGLHAA